MGVVWENLNPSNVQLNSPIVT